VNFSNGASLTCTPYHKFLIHESYEDNRSIKDSLRVDAQDLKEGMKLKKFDSPILDGTDEFPHAYTHGFFCGDGTYSNGRPTCSLYGGKKDLVPHLEIRSMTGIEDASGRLNTTLPLTLRPKFEVPLNASLANKLRWLEGLCDADGTIARNGTNEAIQISSIEFQFLDAIRMMLLTMGVHAKVAKAFDARLTVLPDGKGGQKEFECKPLWRLLISSSGLYTLALLDFKPKRLVFQVRKPQRNAEQFIKIESIIKTGRRDDTYCFNEPINHAGVFNGILTGNCTEIMEYTSPDETAVCNLGSLALPRFVETSGDGQVATFNFDKLRTYTMMLTRNLDKVITQNFYPTEECRNSNMRHRPIGIGVQGLADVFAMLRLPWGSDAAAKLNREIFEHMYYAAMDASITIAEELETPAHMGIPMQG